MAPALRGRQTQFYIDVVYGIALAIGFGYLLFVGMDARVAAFQGGLVLGYILRVWENMSVYERILEEEVAQEAESRVAEEIEEQIPTEAEEQVAREIEEQVPTEAEERVSQEIEDRIPTEAEAQVAREIEEQVPEGMEERVTAEAEEQVVEEAETELLERLGEVDEDLAAELRARLEERAER